MNTIEANKLAQQYYKGIMEFQWEGQTWHIEGVKKIKERKRWRKVLAVSCGEQREFLDLE